MGIFDVFNSNNNRIIINGETIEVSGSNIVVKNNTIMVDGKIIKGGLSGEIHVKFEGDLAKLNCNTCEISGNVHGKVDANTVNCGNVEGDIDANTVHCGDVTGNIDGNTVHCQNLSGKIKK